MRFPIQASWFMEEGHWQKLCIFKGWLDDGKGILPEDDVMFSATDLVYFEIFVKTGINTPQSERK